MNTISQNHKTTKTAFPLVLAEINNVASLSPTQMNNISHSLNMPLDELNDIFVKAQEESSEYNASNALANLSRERLATHIEYCQLGFIEEWDVPDYLELNEHPLVISMGGKLYHTIVYTSSEYDNEIALGCPIATGLSFKDFKLKALPGFSEQILAKINEANFDGFSEFKLGKLHVAIMFVDFNRFLGAVPNYDNLFGENKIQGSLNFVFDVLEFISPNTSQDELQEIFSVLVNTAMLVDWCSEDLIEKVGIFSQGLRYQLSHLICLIVGKEAPLENSEPLFLIDTGNGVVTLVAQAELNKIGAISLMLMKQLQNADLFEWNRSNEGFSNVAALRIR